MTFTEETRKKFDALSVPQIILTYAQLHKPEKPAYTKKEMMELLDVIVDRRVHETGGPPGIDGTMKKATADLIKAAARFPEQFATQPYTTSQYLQTKQIINLFGNEFFTQRSLQRFYDRQTAQGINENFRDIKGFDTEKFKKKKEKGGNPSGFVENTFDYDIELQLYFLRGFNTERIGNKQPIWIAEKQGKTKSLTYKLKNEIAIHLPLIKEGTLTTLDPYVIIAHYFNDEEVFNQPIYKEIFGQLSEEDRSFIKEKKKWRDEEKERNNEEHPKLCKPDEQRMKKICDHLRPYMQMIPKESQDGLLEQAILEFGDIDDMRGIKIVLPDDAYFNQYVNQLISHPLFYREKRLDQHDGTKKRKTSYRASHGWLRSGRFERQDERYELYSAAERKEIHLLNMSTGIIDLLGKDNSWSYHQRQQREKYGHFSKEQKAIADFAEKRIYAIADSITDPFKEVLKERKSEFDTEERYYHVLEEQAERALIKLATR
ncbi:hypothetical protein JXA12_04420 [Candidatus Woesearchaeota archaeon]|nr:hypothetical protein [Candidatus Woesearchaeota archaeon]